MPYNKLPTGGLDILRLVSKKAEATNALGQLIGRCFGVIGRGPVLLEEIGCYTVDLHVSALSR